MLRTSFLLGIGLMVTVWSAVARATTHLETDPPAIAERGGYIDGWWWLIVLIIIVVAVAWYLMKNWNTGGRI